MKKKEVSKYSPNYPYEKKDVTIDCSLEGYPIVEKTYNALLFPLGPQDEIDFKEMK